MREGRTRDEPVRAVLGGETKAMFSLLGSSCLSGRVAKVARVSDYYTCSRVRGLGEQEGH